MTWEKVRLQDIAMDIQTGPFGSQLHQSDYVENGTPVVMPKDLMNGAIVQDTIARVDDFHVEQLSRHKVQAGDILFSRRGDVGRCAYVQEHEEGWLCGTGCLRARLDKKRAAPRFVFYCLQRGETVNWLENHAVGSTMLNLNTTIVGNIPLVLPPYGIQQKIADILSSYDYLIANQQQQIKLLEEAAQRLYKEWFVDLRFPGWEKAEIVDGVPKGWKRTYLGKLIDVMYGKDHKKVPEEGDIPVYGSGGIMRKCNKALYEGESVLIPRKGSLNNIMYVNEAFWTVDTMFYAAMKDKWLAKWVYFYLRQFDMYSMNIGAAVPSMTVKILDAMDVLLPTVELLQKYDEVASNYFSQIKVLQKKCELMQEARDRLLPKLISGEIEVSS